MKTVSKRDKTITSETTSEKCRAFGNIWELKGNYKNYTIDWLIALKAHPYIFRMTIKCYLCLCEKLLISRAYSTNSLNKRDELVSERRCMNNVTLKCFKNR